MRLRLIPSCWMCLSIFAALSCGRQSVSVKESGKDQISLGQSLTNDTKPQDAIFVDFDKNWRQFISHSPEIALPVVAVHQKSKPAPWQPIVQSECVFSPAAGGNVPQVTLTWNESASETSGPAAKSPRQESAQVSPLRFDLAIHYDGFERNYFSSTLASEMRKRFNLPSNSALITNPDALQVTGPSLFPMLMDYNTQMVKAEDSEVLIPRQTLVMRDLAPGLAYTIRTATLGNNQWNEEKKFAFSTPVCPKEF